MIHTVMNKMHNDGAVRNFSDFKFVPKIQNLTLGKNQITKINVDDETDIYQYFWHH